MSRHALFTAALCFAAACGSDGHGARDAQEVSSPIYERMEAYFILLDASTFQTWGTGDLRRSEYDELEIAAPWIRVGIESQTVVDSVFLRSPGAPQDGPTARMDMHGAEWEHIVDILEPPAPVDEDGRLLRTVIDKHHRMVVPGGGNTLRLLVDPDGNEYFLVNREPDRTEEIGALPAGWSHRHLRLEDDLVLELRGTLWNLQDEIGDLYQGPIDW